jgi:hypothetical protein
MNTRLLFTALLIAMPSVAMAADRLPLGQLKAGRWEVERHIRKVGEEPKTRKSEYCASPKKEIGRVLSLAGFLCKSDVKKVKDDVYNITASCSLPGGLSGSNSTTITLHSAEKYSIETHTKGTKFGGVATERSESITAIRVGDCDEKDQESIKTTS